MQFDFSHKYISPNIGPINLLLIEEMILQKINEFPIILNEDLLKLYNILKIIIPENLLYL
jgi:hypothetical protein